MELTARARRRGMVAILTITALMYGGFFMVIPLVSVHFVDGLGFAAAMVGLSLATRQMLQQGTAILGGMLADRMGVRGLIAAGVLIRSLGFVSLAWATTPAALMLAMVLSALGGALFDAPSRAAMAALAPEEDRARFYAASGVANGVAMTVGPLVGALLIRYDFQLVCFAAAACFAAIFFVTLLALPPLRVAEAGQPLGAGFGLVLRDRPFLLFTALLMGYWFMWVQITLSLPLAAERVSGSSDAVGVIYALNAGMTVVLQYPLLRLAQRFMGSMAILVLGVAVMALGLGAVALTASYWGLLACVVVFSAGNVLASPTQQTVSTELADQRALGSYFGINALALAFGGGLGNLAGGWLTDIARQSGAPALPWLVFCLVGLLSAGGLALMGLRRRAPRPGESLSPHR